MTRPLLLDLFCGAGGAAMGYSRAGFDVVGIDINPQAHYPFDFIKTDALTYLMQGVGWYDAIHASPPCQAYSAATPDPTKHDDLYEQTRTMLADTGLSWVIENVPGAPFQSGALLCGSAFNLRVRRHRNFEGSMWLASSGCFHKEQGTPLGVYGDGGPGKSTRPSGGGGTKADRKDFAALMGMPWATPAEIVQAIPPAYTEFIGAQLIDHLARLSENKETR